MTRSLDVRLTVSTKVAGARREIGVGHEGERLGLGARLEQLHAGLHQAAVLGAKHDEQQSRRLRRDRLRRLHQLEPPGSAIRRREQLVQRRRELARRVAHALGTVQNVGLNLGVVGVFLCAFCFAMSVSDAAVCTTASAAGCSAGDGAWFCSCSFSDSRMNPLTDSANVSMICSIVGAKAACSFGQT
jgi:hypothetical protein